MSLKMDNCINTLMKSAQTELIKRQFSYILSPQNAEFFLFPVYDHFLGRRFHQQIYMCDWNIELVKTDFARNIIASTVDRRVARTGQTKIIETELLLQLKGGVFVYVKNNSIQVFASTQKLALKTIDFLACRYARKTGGEPHFYLVTMKCDDLALRSVSLDEAWRQDESEMEIHYGSEFLQWHQELVRRLTTRNSGVTLLRGDPGTGKTTFLRHLIVSLNETHRFLYLPLNNGWMLAGFQSVEFWHKQRLLDPDRKLVIIIEDAEEFLMERTNARDGNHVSDLLNIGDGLMGDYLQLHLICTINCPLNVLDKAVTRPGRLLAYRQFKRLSPEHAQRVAQAKGLVIPEQENYSLAEIYNGESVFDENGSRRPIGFVA